MPTRPYKPPKTKPRGPLANKRRPNGLPGKRDVRGFLDPRERHDVGRKQAPRPMCNCGAYHYPQRPDEKARKLKRRKRPHLMFGGRCSMGRWVEEFFEPFKKECRDCGCFDDQAMECQVVEGLEGALHCPELRAFIQYEGIKLYGKAKAAMERLTQPLRTHRSR